MNDLPRKLSRDGRDSVLVRVGFQFALVPTADPLVWVYHPGYPPRVIPPTYRVHFAEVPAFTSPPFVVEGVASFEPDGRRRPSGVMGLVVLRAAVVVPPAP